MTWHLLSGRGERRTRTEGKGQDEELGLRQDIEGREVRLLARYYPRGWSVGSGWLSLMDARNVLEEMSAYRARLITTEIEHDN
jgi:hypothetical protein